VFALFPWFPPFDDVKLLEEIIDLTREGRERKILFW
jgi:hypothetical protein